MFKLSTIQPEEIGGGINLLDLGASGKLPDYWKPLAKLINLIGFDPNKEECVRLNSEESEFLTQKFLPYAIAGESKNFTLYKTNSIYCWSLLEPDLQWLRRFSYSDLFEINETEKISAYTLEDVKELADLDIDAIKIDTQGLELQILNASEKIVKNCIFIETETGFTKNYLGETTFDEIALYMRSKGFGLFAINTDHRISRKNNFSEKTNNEEMLWCEAIWLRDFSRNGLNLENITREKALKALLIFANHGCYSFGLETAKRFLEMDLLTIEEYNIL